MEKYRLVSLERKGAVGDNSDNKEGNTGSPNEIRITQQGKPRNYITYAMNVLATGADEVILKGMGRAMNKTVTIAEILKRKAPLHQITSISSFEVVDRYEPIEEGLDVVEAKRYMSCMTIILSKIPLDKDNIGYQPPLPPEEMQPGDIRSSSATNVIPLKTEA
mmetsp:Transcript_19992/g.28448  ORF Transcript_19992/g.28448 Transcript_19992/m.28448 type:complete len:163 (+) Transcript_19992:152-640(+)